MGGKSKAKGPDKTSHQEGDSEEPRRRHAPGRMLVKSISKSGKVARLIQRLDEELQPPHGAYGALVYTWIKAHLDIEGRMCGHPRVVFGEVVPLLEAVGDQHVKAYLRAMAREGLYVWYEVDGDLYLADPAFGAEQAGMRSRGTGSALPPPEMGMRVVEPLAETQGALFGLRGASQAPASGQMGVTAPPVSRLPPPPPPPPVPLRGVPREEKGREGEEEGNGVCVARAGAEALPPPEQPPPPPPPFGEQMQHLWEEVTERSSIADTHHWTSVLRQVQGNARVRRVDPVVLARGVLVAYQEMLQDAAGAGHHHGSPTVEELAEERWFSAALNWMDGKRPVRKSTAHRGGSGGDTAVTAADGRF